MLLQLSVRDIVLIDRLDLQLQQGLSVLTGETGAGKSILLDALALALGGRGEGALVRLGQAQGQVTAVFDLGVKHPAREAARQAGLDAEGDLILRRVQFADGRTRAFVNDQPASVQTLRALGAAIVEIHGQHDDRALVDAASHRGLLDAFAGLQDKAAEVAKLHEAWRIALKEQDILEARIEAARREADYLRHAAAELTKLAPEPDEETTLAEQRQRMQQSEKVAGELSEAHDLVAGRSSPVASLSTALRRIERRAVLAPGLLDPAVKAIDTLLNAFGEAQSVLEDAMRRAEFDPLDLERSEERLFALRAASRKYNMPVAKLAALAEKFRGDLAALDAGEASLAAIAAAAAQAEQAFTTAAEKLSKARRKAATGLDKAVNAELPPLKLERAKFITEIESDARSAGAHGFDRAEFWVQANPGTRPGPMMKVASGGELSRFMLALKVVLADRGSAPTLVFDEIDSGVGGAVSDAIGQRLARLASRLQVLAVTHAPQVAARAGQHLLIAKQAVDGGKRIATRVEPLDAARRAEELARMLAGETVTSEARAAARTLLKAAALKPVRAPA